MTKQSTYFQWNQYRVFERSISTSQVKNTWIEIQHIAGSDECLNYSFNQSDLTKSEEVDILEGPQVARYFSEILTFKNTVNRTYSIFFSFAKSKSLHLWPMSGFMMLFQPYPTLSVILALVVTLTKTQTLEKLGKVLNDSYDRVLDLTRCPGCNGRGVQMPWIHHFSEEQKLYVNTDQHLERPLNPPCAKRVMRQENL